MMMMMIEDDVVAVPLTLLITCCLGFKFQVGLDHVQRTITKYYYLGHKERQG